MEGFDGHPGTVRLASVLSRRMKRENESPLVLDFGEIQTNHSLVTNTFPVPVPKGEYSVCRHTADMYSLNPGDHVLVAWVQSEAVIIDIVISS